MNVTQAQKRRLIIDRVGPVEVNQHDAGQVLLVTEGDGTRRMFSADWGEGIPEDKALEWYGIDLPDTLTRTGFWAVAS